MGRYPSHFTPAQKPVERGADDTRLVQVLDALSVGDQLIHDASLAVGVDASGRLSVAGPRDPERFFEGAHQQLVLHQVSAPQGARHLAVDGLWFFDLQVVEQVSDATTLNDPVFLYGTLYGPVRGASTQPLNATHGQLAVTRADVLEAFVRAQPFGASARAGGGPTDRSWGLLLPGESETLLNQGEGFILALPVPPAELSDTGGNGAMVRSIIHQVLSEVQTDLAGRKRSVLSKLFVSAPSVGVELHASVDELLSASRRALALIDSWPVPRVDALFSRVGPPRAVAPVSSAVATPRALAPTPRRSDVARDDDWMKDFVNAHVAEGRAPARVTPARGTAANWMSDFDSSPPTKAPAPAAKPAQPSAKPDWMKDLE